MKYLMFSGGNSFRGLVELFMLNSFFIFFLNASCQTPQRHKSLSIVVVSFWVVESCVSVIHARSPLSPLPLLFRWNNPSASGPRVLSCVQKGKWELLAGRRCRGMLRHSCLYAVSSKASSLTLVYQSALSQPALCTGKWKERSWVFTWKRNLSRLQDVRIDKYLLNTLTGIQI